MFTERFDIRLWNNHLYRIFPHLNQTQSVQDNRLMIYQERDQV